MRFETRAQRSALERGFRADCSDEQHETNSLSNDRPLASPEVDLTTHTPAELVGLHAERISSRWLEQARRASPDREPELREHLPGLLRELGQVLERASGPEPPHSETDGRRAHRLGFDLEQVVQEYSLLRDCVLEVLNDEGVAFGAAEVRALAGAFSGALVRSVHQHGEQRRRVELRSAEAAHAAVLAEREAVLLREQAISAEARADRQAQHDLFMQAPVAIAILEGHEHRFTFANPAYRALVDGRDVVGLLLYDALPDVREQHFDALLDRVISTGETLVGTEVPIRLHGGEGESLFFNFVYTPKRNRLGIVEGVLMSGSDVTEQVRARQRLEVLAAELRASEAELRLVTDALPFPVSFVSRDERYVLVNRVYEEWFGVSSEAIIGRTLLDLIGPAAYALLQPNIRRALSGERFSFEQQAVPYRSGGTRDIKVWFVPRIAPSGAVHGYVALLQDITAQRRAAAEIQRQSAALQQALANADRLNLQLGEAELILRNLVNNLPELAWSAAPNGQIDFFNQRWFDYTGTTLEEVEGWGWVKVHDPAILPEVKARWEHSLASGEPFEMEYPLRAADGSFQWFLSRVRGLRDGAGQLVRWIGTNTNIQGQRDTIKRAEEASRTKDEFLATASHELRTPLNAILGWARMLRGGHVDPSAFSRGLETIERNANAQVQLIEDILDGSRIITGKLHLEIRPLDLISLVNAALDAVRPAAEAKGITLTLALEPAAARIIGDPERLQQVVWNLANNAVKFTPKGGAVEIALVRSGASVDLSVSDTGQGIEADFLPFVFDRFRQAEGSTTRRHGGLGLGLALVRHLVEAHGGTVRAESEGPGRGARFVVRLPVQAVIDAPLPDSELRRGAPVSAAPVSDSPASLTGVSVLVVDDEDDARLLVATVLRASGAEVTTASGAAQALAQLARGFPKVLISDIGMPEVDGYELMRRIRSSLGTKGAEIPAIALTAYSREQDRRLAMEAGFQTHVSKPVEPAELVRVVGSLVRFLKRQSSNGEAGGLERVDTFLKFEKVLETRGIQESLRFLNSRTSHRFTALYRFDPPHLHNLYLVDSYDPNVKTGEDVPLVETYCSIIRASERSFSTEDTRRDPRLSRHPAREVVISYCGVLLRDAKGNAFGTLCHFDLVPSDIPISELPLMEAAAPLIMTVLERS